jgi:hypothetical protein
MYRDGYGKGLCFGRKPTATQTDGGQGMANANESIVRVTIQTQEEAVAAAVAVVSEAMNGALGAALTPTWPHVPEDFGQVCARAIRQILPAHVALDVAMESMGYVPKSAADAACDAAGRLAQRRGDRLQLVEDEMLEVSAENSRLRRKLERLERKR